MKIKHKKKQKNMVLFVGILLAVNLLFIDRFISSQFEASMFTLDSILPSKGANK